MTIADDWQHVGICHARLIQINRFMLRNKHHKVLIISAVVILLSIIGYRMLIYYPVYVMSDALFEFEQAARTNDLSTLKKIVSEEAVGYKYLLSPQLKEGFERFEPGIEVEAAEFGVMGDRSVLGGYAKMRARKDGQYRELADLFLIEEGGQWKILQFGFSDFFDY